MIKFFNNGDSTFDVRVATGDSWYKVGELKHDKDQQAWVLWQGTSYSDEESGLAKDSDDGVSYDDDLEEAKKEIEDDLLNNL